MSKFYISRTIHELLLILRKSVEEAEEISGLCSQMDILYRDKIIDLDEKYKLCLYIIAVKPIDVGHMYWWTKGEKKPRLEFLDKQLLRTKHLKN